MRGLLLIWPIHTQIKHRRVGRKIAKILLHCSSKRQKKAVLLDQNEPYAHIIFGRTFRVKKDFERAIESYEKAVALSPNDPELLRHLASTLIYSGRFDDAILRVKEAQRIHPFHNWRFPFYLARANYSKRDYTRAAAEGEKAERLNPRARSIKSVLAATYAQMGRKSDADAVVARLLKISPNFAYGKIRLPYKNPAILAHIKEGWRKAGLREK